MGYSLSEYLTAQFYAWEQRGRGWKVFEEPVHLESEFIPFFGHLPPERVEQIDTGKRPRFFPALQETLGLYKTPSSEALGEIAFTKLEEMYPLNAYTYVESIEISELQINFNKDTRILFDSIEQLLLMISTCEGIVGFEIFGSGEKITIQFVCPQSNAGSIKSFIATYAPGVSVHESINTLIGAIDFEKPAFAIDLGLKDEFMRPLRVWNKFDPDPLTGCIASLESIQSNEFGMLQILFQKAANPWAESVYRSVMDGSGGPFFEDAVDMLPLAREKVSSPLLAVVIRAIGQAETEHRAIAISNQIAQSLISFHRTGSNTLIPLTGEISGDAEDILARKSRRIGMLLNSNELASMVHIPDRSVVSPKLRAYSGKTKQAPKDVLGNSFSLGINSHLGKENLVTLSDPLRLRHMHVIGGTGTGKSSLLLNLITQDIEQGRGLTVLDPHGDLIEEVITHIPEERLKDVILVDPSDSEYPIGLNLLSAYSEAEKTILASDLVALFRRFATSWGDQMTSVLANAITAILESHNGGTLIDLRRILVESSFRNKFLQTVDDPNIQYYWKNEYPLLRTNAVAPILTRLDTFLRPKLIRNMMAQKEGLDFRDILNTQKILLVKLAQGLIGEENSYLLGTLFVAKLNQAAQSRQNLPPDQRKPHYLYIDEFQNFITPSMSSILSGARKYGLGLILAHQDLDQLARKDGELANSVLSNPAIRVCFRCGDKDASKLEDGFSYFDSTDLQNLGVGQAIVRVGQKNHDFNLSFSLLQKEENAIAEEKQNKVIDHCRSTYALHQSKVEELLKDALQVLVVTSKLTKLQKLAVEDKPIPEPTIILPEKVTEKEKTELNLNVEAQQFIAKEIAKEKLKEHRFIQEYIKSVAEARNFKAVFEEPINDKTGKVDVSLLRDELKIACEISVTNTVEYEVQNILKCLKANYLVVFMISNDSKHLNAIRELATITIDSSLHSRVYFVSKDEFINQLDLLLAQQNQPTETRAKGYRVKVTYTSSNDNLAQQKTLKEIVLSSLRRKDREE
ncbi:MAG TPA: type IV secretion system DNA-binding domain-containing protein [Saprospiraceae bacterium]|nr:type IV secretion system DNA-binding domain-containing protein [Saprospiraceae bacterium]